MGGLAAAGLFCWREQSSRFPLGMTERKARAEVFGGNLIVVDTQWLLPVMSLLCWAMYRWVAGTNALVLLFWMVIVVLGLPQMILLWTEPEDVREMQVVGGVEA